MTTLTPVRSLNETNTDDVQENPIVPGTKGLLATDFSLPKTDDSHAQLDIVLALLWLGLDPVNLRALNPSTLYSMQERRLQAAVSIGLHSQQSLLTNLLASEILTKLQNTIDQSIPELLDKKIKPTEKNWAALWEHFTIYNQLGVTAFLTIHTFLFSILEEVAHHLAECTHVQKFVLDVDEDFGPALLGEARLRVDIPRNAMPIEDAFDAIDRFEKTWWANKADEAKGMVFVGVEI